MKELIKVNSIQDWRPCNDEKDKFPWGDYYLVNVNGQIKSTSRTVKAGEYTRTIEGRILSTSQRQNKHASVNFCVTIEGEKYKKTAYPHRYVALAFIPNPKGYKFVSHYYNDKGEVDYNDNHAGNLFWASQSMISKRTMIKYPKLKLTLKKANLKSGYYKKKIRIELTDKERQILEYRKERYTYREIVKLTGCTYQKVYRVINKKAPRIKNNQL